jgi:hypothetical protein
VTDERWLRVKALFQTVVERPAEERDAFLAAATGDDAALRREVESLLAADTSDVSLLDRLPVVSESVVADPLAALPTAADPVPSHTALGAGHAAGLTVAARIPRDIMDANLQRQRFLASRLQMQSLFETADTTLDTREADGVAFDAPPLPRFAAGDLINGRYEVTQILGEGGMGVVYRVRDRMFQLRPTALKTMRRLSDGDWLDLFRSEFIVLSELNHPNVAGVYEFAPLSEGAGHFFTMEFVPGQRVGQSVDGASPSETWQCITHMGEALAYLHSRDILHLDVKPDNAVRMPDSTCKLLDFGLVGLAQKPGRIAGTLAYMDPELMHGAQPSALSDLYCLGLSGLELLVGCRPYADAPGAAALLQAKHDRRFPYTTAQMEGIPEWMRDCLLRLCADALQDRFRSAAEFLDEATRAQGRQRRPLTVSRSAFVGRREERQRIHAFARRRLIGGDGPVLCPVSAPSGMGKSRLVAGIRHELQAEGHVFLQGDAYDRDVGEFTALTPVLLASAQLVISLGRRDIVDAFLPELVKMAPEFGHLYGSRPSLPYSHGEAERERISHAARDYLLEVSAVVPFVMYLNDLQWAADGTINALMCLVDALISDAGRRIALVLSVRSDQISGRPIEGWLASLDPVRQLPVVLAPLEAPDVQAMMSSIAGLPVSPPLVAKMHDATGGVPFYIDETMRWLARAEALRVQRGEIVAARELDWKREIDDGIVSQADQQSPVGQDILRLLAISARPVALVHLCAAAGHPQPRVVEELSLLEQERLVTPVASDSAMYSLDHDRIRESLFSSTAPSDRIGLHARLGGAFLQDFATTRRGDVAVFAAVHLNEAPLPTDKAGRLERSDLNLDAAQSARNAGDFGQALSFLGAAETALAPDMWRHHEHAMRLHVQRATTLRAMLKFDACVAECDAGIAHARDLVEEGRLCVPKMESLNYLRRHADVLDIYVSFLNRTRPVFRVPRHPGWLAALGAALKTWRLVKTHGVAHLMRPMDVAAHPLATEAVRVTEPAVNSAFVAAPRLFIFQILSLAHVAATHGSLREGALTAPVGMAIIVGILRDFEMVATFGRTVKSRLDELPDEHRGRARFLWAHWPANLSLPLLHLLEPAALAATECRRARDVAYEANAQWGLLMIELFLGQQPLGETARRAQGILDQWPSTETPEAAYYIGLLEGAIAALRAPSTEIAAAGAERRIDPSWSASTRAVAAGFAMVTSAWGVGGASRDRGIGWREVWVVNQGVPGTTFERLALFAASIANCAALRTRLPPWRRLELRLVTHYILSTQRRFAALNPIDFAHRVAFVEAELLRARGALEAALPLYQKAASLAKDAGLRSEQALILEKHAEVLIALGRGGEAAATVAASLALYRAWEAVAKVKQLEERFAGVA